MTKFDKNWVAAEEAKRQWMAENGLYREEYEHASCGVGLVVSIDGKPSRKVVENGIAALKAVWHRCAVDADGKTGDGAGIHVQIPVPFFYDQVRRTGHVPRKGELTISDKNCENQLFITIPPSTFTILGLKPSCFIASNKS